jgi:tyrosinase
LQTERVNVRVQGLNRLKILGSFGVHLLKDGKRIASRGFFQPNEVDKCENCVKNAIVHFDFELPLAKISKGKLEAVVEPVDKSLVGERFPNELMGNPTIDVHFLMTTE